MSAHCRQVTLATWLGNFALRPPSCILWCDARLCARSWVDNMNHSAIGILFGHPCPCSDGEGFDAEVHVALWSSRFKEPVPGFLRVPLTVRASLPHQRRTTHHVAQGGPSKPQNGLPVVGLLFAVGMGHIMALGGTQFRNMNSQ